MNIHPKKLTTVELITQQALEISRLNFKNNRITDELAEAYHPEFGSIWRYKELITELSNTLIMIGHAYKISCVHGFEDIVHEECCSCEMDKVLKKIGKE